MRPDMTSWTGRIDPEPATLRWHQIVKPLAGEDEAGIALIGFCSDEGVRRNHGRAGAYDGPAAIREALGPLAYHQSRPIYDVGDVACDDGDLSTAQATMAIAKASRPARLNPDPGSAVVIANNPNPHEEERNCVQHCSKSSDPGP